MKKSKWIPVARVLICFFLLTLFIASMELFKEIRRDVLYGSRSYGLNALNELFDNGEYQKVYLRSMSNKYADDKLSTDVSQYEAFGRYYHYYTLAVCHEDNAKYLDLMKTEKEKITWKKILSVIEMLEDKMNKESEADQ